VRLTNLFGTTLREAPADADVASHQLLLRAGYVRQLAAGIFSYLPLAQRSLLKIATILREELDAIGGQEISMPVVHPAELWQATGRWYEIDETMARFEDRRGRDMLLAMTHEEVVAQIASTEVRSYRQLPILVYQIQTKFRDELRSRGGLIRVREFLMKDSYSLDRDAEGLRLQYDAHYGAYLQIGRRAGLPLTAVLSDVGMMGGQVAHEFMYITPIGEDSLVLCKGCDYAANLEVARFRREEASEETPRPIERVHTPGTSTIADLAEFLAIEPRQTGKIIFFMGAFANASDRTGEADDESVERLVVAIVRGDMDANPIRVQQLLGAAALRPAHQEEIEAAGAVPGFASPIGIDRSRSVVVVDEAVARSPNLVLGANEPDYHVRDTNYGRDYEADHVGEIASAFDGAPCPECDQALQLVRGVEVGNIFQLGTKYSEALGAFFTDEDGEERPIVLGSYGIGLGRLLACVVEEHRDERGMALPISVAPFAVSLVSLAKTGETAAAAERLYEELQDAGIDVLYDHREASPGVKLNDADLQGMPLRLVVSERSLKQGGVELKRRTEAKARSVPLDEAVDAVRDEIEALEAELAQSYM
jgi:prolyl-tRNA synthetase